MSNSRLASESNLCHCRQNEKWQKKLEEARANEDEKKVKKATIKLKVNQHLDRMFDRVYSLVSPRV